MLVCLHLCLSASASVCDQPEEGEEEGETWYRRREWHGQTDQSHWSNALVQGNVDKSGAQVLRIGTAMVKLQITGQTLLRREHRGS